MNENSYTHPPGLSNLLNLITDLTQDNLKSKKKRKQTDYQYTELLVVVWLLHIPGLTTYNKQTIIDNKQNILNDPRFKCNPTTIEKYFKDLQEYGTDKGITQYIQNINTDLIKLDFKTIYLTGKTCFFEEITKLMKENHLNSRQKKGDIYLKYNNGLFTSISVKQDSKCFLTNYSTEKLANECNLLTISDKIKQERISISKIFIPNYDNIDREEKKRVYKTKREKVNTYLSDYTLQIWKDQEQIIKNPDVQTQLKKSLFPNVNFKNIEYNGDSWRIIPSYTDVTEFKIERCTLLDTKDSAKIWFIIYKNGRLTYKADIRLKSGYLFAGSLQILCTHLDNNNYNTLKSLLNISP